MVQLLYPYMTTGKTIALTILTFVSKVISLLFNMLSRFVTAFLPRSKCLLISWLRLPSTGIVKVKVKPLSRVHLFMTPWTLTHQAPPSLGFSRQEYWRALPFPSPVHESEKWKWSRLVVSDSSRPHGLQPTRLLHPWDFPGKSTGVGCHRLFLS